MDSNNNQLTSPEEKEQITRVQKLFLDQVSQEPSLYYPQDVEMVKSDDWWTLRFIKWNRGNEEKALKQMIAAFKWRKSFGLHDRTVNDLPCEFAKAGAFFPHGYDRKGRPIIYLRVKVYRKIQQLDIFFQQFVAGVVNHVDALGGRNGFVLLWDISGLGLINFDMDFINFLIQLLQHNYPYGLRYSIMYNMPKVLRHLWTFTKVFLGGAEKTFGFCNSADDLKKYIPSKWLLRYMGGENNFDFTDFPEVRNAPSVRELGPKYGFNDQKEIEAFLKIFEDHIKEAKQLAMGHCLK